MTILLTGMAGFIGYHTARHLCQKHQVIGIDNLNDYYDTALKQARMRDLGFTQSGDGTEQSTRYSNLSFIKRDLTDPRLEELFRDYRFDAVINLAAQAGVRYSLENPQTYITSNIEGFLHILECCRKYPVRHLIFASSSSVYGLNRETPFRTAGPADHPVSLYAATKRSNELMAHSYSHLFGIPCTGLRFFTVYGPWGRPDMAYYLFTDKISRGESIDVFNNGDMERDFTYVDDIVEPIDRLLDLPPAKGGAFSDDRPDTSSAPFRLLNIGNNSPIRLMDFIGILEEKIGKKAQIRFKEMQPGDVVKTWADVDSLTRLTGYRPSTPPETGLTAFVEWYKTYAGS